MDKVGEPVLISTLRLRRGEVTCVDTAGGRLVGGSGDGTLRLWRWARDVAWLEFAEYPRAHRYGVTGVSFSASGILLATIGIDGAARIWSACDALVVRRTLAAPDAAAARSLEWASSDRLVVGHDDGGVRVWMVRSGTLLAYIRAHEGAVYALTAVDNVALLLTACTEGVLKVFDFEEIITHGRDGTTGPSPLLWEDGAHDLGVLCATQYLKRVATGGHDGRVRIWRVEGTGRERTVLGDIILIGHTAAVTALHWVRDLLASASLDRTARLWATNSATCIRVLHAHSRYLTCITLASDIRYVVTGSNDKSIRMWSLGDFSAHDDLDPPCNPLAHFALGDLEGIGPVEEADVDEVENSLECTNAVARCVIREPHASAINSIAISTHMIATACSDGYVRVFRYHEHDKTLQQELQLSANSYPVMAVDFGANGALLLSGGLDGCARVWDVQTGCELMVLSVESCGSDGGGGVRDVRISSHRPPLLLVASDDGLAALWSIDPPGPDPLQFWEIENEVLTNERKMTKEEQMCEEIYKKTTVRIESGRYQVHIPFKENIEPVEKCGKTKEIATSRFLQLERKFKYNIKLKQEYSSAPFLAVRTLFQVAEDEEQRFILAASIVKKAFYMDDLMCGANDVCQAMEIYKQVNGLLKCAGFELQKWTSICNEVLDNITQSNPKLQPFEIKFDKVIKILGLSWDRIDDTFKFYINLPDLIEPITKRTILSEVARLFDPFGWLAPVIIKAKIIIQRLWLCTCGWDEDVPINLKEEWLGYRQRLQELEKIKLERWIYTYPEIKRVELHGFADASVAAYAAVVYVKVFHRENIHVTILESKTKIETNTTDDDTLLEAMVNGIFTYIATASQVAKYSCVYSGLAAAATCCAWAAGGRALAAGGAAGELRVLAAPPRPALLCQKADAHDLEMSISEMSIEEGSLELAQTLPAHGGAVQCVRWGLGIQRESELTLATGGADRWARVWRVAVHDMKLDVQAMVAVPAGAAGGAAAVRLLGDGDEASLVVGSLSGTLAVWQLPPIDLLHDTESAECIYNFKGSSVSESEAARLLAAAGAAAFTGAKLLDEPLDELMLSFGYGADSSEESNELAETRARLLHEILWLRREPLSYELEDSAPHFLRCPLTHAVLREPARASDGFTYERQNILDWILAAGTVRSPMSGRRLSSLLIEPNYGVRNQLRQFCAWRP
ncbi:uncharacterized protein LOC126773520 [Nymphalis io]|uniref:uncharacterized protein LOC126773520 n=1 Tax=Inachis io TaxID=171585 RepID=UPI002168E3F1|nr:uncharacterized protein LOC126773520 [Nymphalis io]